METRKPNSKTDWNGIFRLIGGCIITIGLLAIYQDYMKPENVEARWRREKLESYLTQIRNHDISFEQAGCEYRGGEWDYDKTRCREFHL